MWVIGFDLGRRELANKTDRRAAEIVHSLFGANFQQQGRGFYVSLELLAICRGVLDSGKELLAEGNPVEYWRRSHDLARRLATDELVEAGELDDAIDGERTAETLRALLGSLVVTIPGRRRAPRWYAAHLYPFVGELVHYDAVERRGAPSIERYVFRDGGGFAYHVLRTDHDLQRRARNRSTLESLVQNSETALGQIANALHSHDRAKEKKEFEDDSESEAVVNDAISSWPEFLRAGLDNIGSRSDVPRAKRVEQILHWIPYCVARHVLRLARNRQGQDVEVVPVDCSRSANPVRAYSQDKLNIFRIDVVKAVTATAVELRDASGEQSGWDKYTRSDSKFAGSPRAFFTETLAAVGALNATTGKRHFTFKAPILEAMVAATIGPGQVVEFGEYCQQLFDQFGLVIGPHQARQAGATMHVDEADFKVNFDSFRNRLENAGLLTRYSDETDLVHGEIR